MPIFSGGASSSDSGGGGAASGSLSFIQKLNSSIKAVTTPDEGMGNNSGFTDGRLYLTAVDIPEDTTITGVQWFQVTSGSFTADNYSGLGLYSVDGTTATLIGESSNDANLFKGNANEWATKAFNAPIVVTAGLHFISILSNRDTTSTIPTIGVAPGWNVAAMAEFGGGITANGYLSSTQTSNPASVDLTTLTNNIQRYWLGLY